LNVLFTMFEAERLPDCYRGPCALADLVVVPSHHNQQVFGRAGVDTEVCPLGIDPAIYHWRPRRAPERSEPFRYLWLGAPNPRKGWPTLDRAWRGYFAGLAGVELYVKTTSGSGVLSRYRNVICDSRTLSETQIASLYASAHCFVFPSHGEGFGLTLA